MQDGNGSFPHSLHVPCMTLKACLIKVECEQRRDAGQLNGHAGSLMSTMLREVWLDETWCQRIPSPQA